MSNDGWEYMDDIDYYSDIQKRIPGIGVTSGFRTKEYQEDMKRRGYKPAENSGHLRGEKLDFTPPKGKSWAWLNSQIKKHYPEAEILNEGDHLDVRFPGYNKAPALGNAVKAGVSNPNRSPQDDGWSYVDDEPEAAWNGKPAHDKTSVSTPELGWWDRVTQRASEMSDLAGQGLNSAAARFLYENMTGMNDQEKEQFRQKILGERKQRGAFWEEQDNKSEGLLSSAGDFIADLLGDTAGDLNPTALIAPGRSPLGRIVGAAAVNAGVDAGVQGAELGQGLQEEWDLGRTGMNAAGGALLQGGGEIVSALAKKLGGTIREGASGPEIVVKEADGTTTWYDANALLEEEQGLTGGVVTDDRPWDSDTPRPLEDQPVVQEPHEVARQQLEEHMATPRTQEEETAINEIVTGLAEQGNTTPEIVANDPSWRGDVRAALMERGVDQMAIDRPAFQESAEIIPFPTKEEPTARNLNEPDFLVPENDNLGTARAAQVPEAYRPETASVSRANVANDAFDPIAKESPKAAPKYEAQVNEITKDWTNAPEFKVVDSLDDFEPEIARAIQETGGEDALGFVGTDGKIYIIGDNIKDPSEVPAVVFHEALGHVGLNQQFGKQLDTMLIQMYRTNEKLSAEVHNWMDEFGPAYKDVYDADEPEFIARAVEEVLAQRSEKGIISASSMDNLVRLVRQYARKLGLKMKISDREVKAIMAMAHNKVIAGDPSGNTDGLFRAMITRKDPPEPANDNTKAVRAARAPKYPDMPEGLSMNSPKGEWAKRYRELAEYHDSNADWMKARMKRFGTSASRVERINKQYKLAEEYREKAADRAQTELENKYMIRRKNPDKSTGNINTGKLTSTRDVERFVVDAAEDISPNARQSNEETLAAAKAGKLTRQELMDLQGMKAEEAVAARQYMVTALNKLDRLSKLIDDETATLEQHMEFNRLLNEYPAIQKKVSEIASEAGRLLQSFNIEARGGTGGAAALRYILQNMKEGQIMTPSEARAYAKQMQKASKKAERKEKVLDAITNAINLPKSMMSSFDLSAPLRQGIFLIGNKEFYPAFFQMFKLIGSDKAYKALLDNIKGRPTYGLMKRGGLGLTSLEGKLSQREEAFVSQWAEKIPVYGEGVKASERAYTGFLDKLRADTFDSIYHEYRRAGIDLRDDAKLLREVSKYVNNATGRGDLGSFTQAAHRLNTVFFSPRLIASRVAMLNPVYYAGLSPILRKRAIKSLLSFGAIASTAVGLAALMGADVETNPTSSDFMKARVGNTRYDMFGGFQQYAVLGARLATNERKTAKGKVVEMGEKYGSKTGMDTIEDFVESKFSPTASYFADMIRGKNMIGEEFKPGEDAVERFIPMFLQDAYKVIEEEGAVGVPMALPGLFGVGIGTYDENKPRPKATPKEAKTETKWEYVN